MSHKTHKTFTLDELTKVEGHAKLLVEMDGERVKKAEMEVYEPSRYFESMVIGKSYEDVPSISQRICGICSVVHTITSIKAIEKAMEVEPSKQTEDLRRLLLYSSIIHNHTAHLFFFAAPDYLGVNDVIEMARKKRELVNLAIELMKGSSRIVKMIGGRSLHPVTPRVGGFNSVPTSENIQKIMLDFKELKKMSEKAARLFMSVKLPEFENKSQYLGLTDKVGYPLYDGDIGSFGSSSFKPADYKKHIKEEVLFRSTAKYASFNGKPYMVGSLPRLNLNHKNMSDSAKSLLKQSGIKVPCFNPFVNNLAQTLEMVHFSDIAMQTLGKYEQKGMVEERPEIKPKAGEGVAACEAPRGTLYHHYKFDGNGKATFANIITPTCQNVRNMEFDMQHLLPGIIKQPDKKVKRMLEMLIRAYDPCFSCSTHFLDLKLRR
jgi:coenzyme F420-reducing hydrogenase alpha subunit